jgi:Aminotransferase class-III
MIDSAGAESVAAMMAEPIQGAGGVIIPPKSYWPELAQGLKERDILLISDEVICGFGRTGSWFGCELMGTEPDVMTLAKGITSGYVPLSAVAVSDRIASLLLAKGGEFAHGYTYSGHPAACAAAIANLIPRGPRPVSPGVGWTPSIDASNPSSPWAFLVRFCTGPSSLSSAPNGNAWRPRFPRRNGSCTVLSCEVLVSGQRDFASPVSAAAIHRVCP